MTVLIQSRSGNEEPWRDECSKRNHFKAYLTALARSRVTGRVYDSLLGTETFWSRSADLIAAERFVAMISRTSPLVLWRRSLQAPHSKRFMTLYRMPLTHLWASR